MSLDIQRRLAEDRLGRRKKWVSKWRLKMSIEWDGLILDYPIIIIIIIVILFVHNIQS